MNLVYFSHSYREQDALCVNYFGRLMRSEGLIPSLDPPSESVNAAKLESHLNSSDGMVAVLTFREGGVSPYILFEIGLCLRARKPLLVFVEDVLPDDLVPSRVLQRRFSRHSFLRQVREHRHALQMMKTYMGNPPPTYQPSPSRRSCLLTGVSDLEDAVESSVQTYVEKRGYSIVDLHDSRPFTFEDISMHETLASSDLALCCVDSEARRSSYLLGAIQAAFVACIALTFDESYPFDLTMPRELQPRFIDAPDEETIEQTLAQEFDTYEEDFVKLDNQEEVETYTSLLVDTAELAGRYDEATRRTFVRELVMGDKYSTGPAIAVGRGAHAHDMTVNQVWNQLEGSVDLSRLAEELSLLREAMKREATEAKDDMAVGAVAAAEQAAKSGNGPRVLEYLKPAGKWALDTATRIGAEVAVAVIKGSMQV